MNLFEIHPVIDILLSITLVLYTVQCLIWTFRGLRKGFRFIRIKRNCTGLIETFGPIIFMLCLAATFFGIYFSGQNRRQRDAMKIHCAEYLVKSKKFTQLDSKFICDNEGRRTIVLRRQEAERTKRKEEAIKKMRKTFSTGVK